MNFSTPTYKKKDSYCFLNYIHQHTHISQVDEAWSMGNHARAEQYSRQARKWNVMAVVAGVIVWSLLFAVIAVSTAVMIAVVETS